ncbi:MAG: insulinase family protein [Phycisphaerales bacterium]|nr:insulinase family protein [Phycisphaerales bacterium]
MIIITRALCAFTLAATTTTTHAGNADRFTLDNGMRVILRPIDGAQSTALVTLFTIGERHDPAGASGMAHMMEHLLVTAAAGNIPARTAEVWFTTYAPPLGGANAQTGEDYTVLATVFPNEHLESELDDLAARLEGLTITQSDLDRELPRLELELSNMFGGIPHLASMNLAREAIRPSGEGFRKGGLIDQLRAVTVDQAQRFADAYYKPRNALVVIAGGFDADQTRALIEQHVADIESGDAPPPMRNRANLADVPPQSIAIDAADWNQGAPIVITRAIAAPAPDSPHYAPFLVHITRLFQKAMASYKPGDAPPVQYALIDDPHTLYIAATATSEDELDNARDKIDELIKAATIESADKPVDTPMTAMQFGWMFGSTDVPEAALVNNPYGVAFALGRAELMGINWPTLRGRLNNLTREDMESAAESIFSESNSAEVIVSVAPSAP